MADEKSPSRISHRLFETSRSEKRYNMLDTILETTSTDGLSAKEALICIGVALVLGLIISIIYIFSDRKRKLSTNFAITLVILPAIVTIVIMLVGSNVARAFSMAGAFALAIGIAIQNFPEGAIISMPLKSEGISKLKAFWYGTLSGIVEPIGAVLTIALTNLVVPILPYFLSFLRPPKCNLFIIY